mmetsp:Transcript_12303/g.31460  ORF Transcript_12303/g.31460 Transcript_12303/m.31460 type:complete len:112 (-) Transcript_12303:645-980(-)
MPNAANESTQVASNQGETKWPDGESIVSSGAQSLGESCSNFFWGALCRRNASRAAALVLHTAPHAQSPTPTRRVLTPRHPRGASRSARSRPLRSQLGPRRHAPQTAARAAG